MITDSELLRQYVKDGSEAAFKELVLRYAGLVYPAALRLTNGGGYLAEEITQDVFILLARKAPMLIEHETLAGWLHTSTRYIALRALHHQRRRETREQEIAAMPNNSNPEIPWEQLRPMLDEAVGQLEEHDRDAVLLRYFQGKSHREVGTALGLSEDTARVRTERAVEKLRRHFARSGVIASATLLAEVMTTNLAQAAPPTLVNNVTQVALAKKLGLGHLLLKTFYMTTKTKIALTTAAVVAVTAAVPLALQNQAKTRLQDELKAAQQKVTALQISQHKVEAQLANKTQQLQTLEMATAPASTQPKVITGGAPGQGLDANSDLLVALDADFDAAYAKDPAAAMSALGAIYAKVATANGAPQVDLATLKAQANLTAETIADPASAATAALNMPPGKDRNTAIVAAATAWVQKDPGAASEWMATVVNTLPQEDKTQEHVIEALLPAAIKEDPSTAFVWANTIGDQQVRFNRITDVVIVWAKTDPVAAAQAVQSANLPEDTRAGLVLHIQALANAPAN